VAVAAGATGGVALAATSTPAGAHSVTAPSATAAATTRPASDAGSDASADSTTDPAAADPAASPHPSLLGLCRAWAAGATDNRGHAATNPAFSALVTAAGGPDAVTGFCAQPAIQAAAVGPPDPPTPTTAPVATTAPAATTGRGAPASQRPVATGAANDHAAVPVTKGAAPTTPAHPTGPPAGVGHSAVDKGKPVTH
jgi:hypothetical protein